MKIKLKYIFILFLILTTTVPAIAGELLQWDINKDASYYTVSYGKIDGEFTNELWKGTATEINFTELMTNVPEDDYYFAVKAFNTDCPPCCMSSEFSDSVLIHAGGISNFELQLRIIVQNCKDYINNLIS